MKLWKNRRDRLLLFPAPSSLGEKAAKRGRAFREMSLQRMKKTQGFLSDLG